MSIPNLDDFLKNCTLPQPSKLEGVLCVGLTYVTTKLFTSVNPVEATVFIAIAIFSANVLKPRMHKALDSYRVVILSISTTDITNIFTAAVISKFACRLLQYTITWKQIGQVTIAWVVGIVVIKQGLKQLS